MNRGTLGIIGYGNMGSAITNGLIKSKRYLPSDIHIFDVDAGKLSNAKNMGHVISMSVEQVGAAADTVILAVKPADAGSVLSELKGCANIRLVLSVIAGLSTKKIEAVLTDIPVIRAMPNAPCLIGSGAIVISRGSRALVEHAKLAQEIMNATGMVLELPEKNMDAVTGLSGSGPAYVALMVEALSDGGVKMGLPRPVALQLAIQTVFGTVKMIMENDIHPATLKDLVASPAGTTIEGIAALEAGGFRSTIIEAVEAATLRSKELGS